MKFHKNLSSGSYALSSRKTETDVMELIAALQNCLVIVPNKYL